MSRAEKTREQRARRMAERQWMKLSRSRARDPLAADFGTYELISGADVVLDCASLDEVERWLRTGHGRELVARAKAGRENPVMVSANTAERVPE